MKIAIMGIGHMGAWLTKILSKKHEVAIYDTDPGKIETFKDATILQKIDELKLFKPEIFLNAVTLKNTISAFKSAVPHLPASCIISDVASIKSEVSDYYIHTPFRFVSVHPMFGPIFANMDLLKEENVVIITESDPQGIEFFQSFFERLGLQIFRYSFAKHDKMMAYSLTLPFVSSLVFAACVDTQTVPGTTFKKHMNIVKAILSEDSSLLAEILFNHHSLNELEKVTSQLEFLKHIIKERDYEEVEQFFDKLRLNIDR